jgi:hypothetical protein
LAASRCRRRRRAARRFPARQIRSSSRRFVALSRHTSPATYIPMKNGAMPRVSVAMSFGSIVASFTSPVRFGCHRTVIQWPGQCRSAQSLKYPVRPSADVT